MQVAAEQVRPLAVRTISDEARFGAALRGVWIGAALGGLALLSALAAAEAKTEPLNAERPGNAPGTLAGYVPKTELGRKLLELRKQYAAKGGKFLNREELDAEVARLRLGNRNAGGKK